MTTKDDAYLPMPAFDLLLGELQRSCGLSEWQAMQMRDVFRGYAGQEVHVPAATKTRRLESVALVGKLTALGVPPAVIVERLMCRGHCRRSSYRIVAAAIAGHEVAG